MSKLVLIVGPQAVGKMTVAQELEKITDLKMMHNHETLELPARLFGWKHPARERLTALLRFAIFEEMAKSNLPGLIFTYVFDFDLESEKKWLEKVKNIFENENGEIYFVELEADVEERLKRNRTENRLANKPSKRNLEWSDKDLLEGVKEYRLNSNDGEVKEKNYLKINNTNISAEEAAKIIKEKFNL